MRMSDTRSMLARGAAVMGGMLGLAAIFASSAAALASAPGWEVLAQPAPTYFKAGEKSAFYEIIAINDGGTPSAGTIAVSDTLPPGVTVNEVVARAEIAGDVSNSEAIESSCSESMVGASVVVTCSPTTKVPPGRTVVVKIVVNIPEGATGSLTNSATISGGGAPSPATSDTSTPVVVGSADVPFGASFVGAATTADGDQATQAGSHPLAFTTILSFNVGSVSAISCGGWANACPNLDAEAKDVEVQLPPGLVGNPNAMPRCTVAQFEKQDFFGCPPYTQVGAMYLYFYGPGTAVQYAPVYNIEPPPGQPAELGFTVSSLGHVPMFFHVRSDGDYGLTADIANITQFDVIRAAVLSIWGVPAESVHDPARLSEYENCSLGSGGCASRTVPKAFLTTPTDCTSGSLTIDVLGDSWQEPEPAPRRILTDSSISGMTGCGLLSFDPTIAVEPERRQAGAPSAYTVHLGVPQKEGVEELATPDVRDAQIALPAGTMLSPSGANGLEACSEAQFAQHRTAPGTCPKASFIGAVKITTPLLQLPLEGHVILGQPECAPCTPQDAQSGKMLPLWLEAEGSGVTIKLAGHTSVDQETGQLTTTFTENPQLPFSDLEVSLKGGEDAAVVNPSACAPAVATAKLTPWSTMTATEVSAPPVEIEGCRAPGFSPSMHAGMTGSADGGSYSGFSVTLSRPDGQQDLRSLTMHMPPGLIGAISKVSRCGEAEANAGTCPASSQIGTAWAVIGPGSEPLTIAGGKVYLTGAYQDQPFGVSVVMPAEAGPFKLSGTNGNGAVVVRAAVAIDPHTSALTIASGEIPHALDGIPLDIRTVEIDVNREGFMLNPTNCTPMSIGGSVTSTSGMVADVSFPFQSVNCATLPFKTSFSARTDSTHTRFGGDSLDVTVESAQGQANLREVHVELPKVLPSRLSTLNQACPEAVFLANPASCPSASRVGVVTAHTPILTVPLTGPAYFVSHGGARFPELIFVLQGEGVTVQLNGETFISKAGITSSTFKTIPDVPVSRVDVVLPAGQDSVLTGEGDLCAHPLYMPTTIVGQNGAVKKERVRIAVAGCKPELIVLRQKVTGATARITVKAPAAGRLTASGRFVSRAVTRLRKAGVATVSVTLTKAEQRLLAHHRGRKLKVHVELRLKATNGQVLTRSTTVLVA